MTRTRICLMVEIDLDPVPGTFHTPASAREQVERVLNATVSHYHPTVDITAHEPIHHRTPAPPSPEARAAWDEYLAEPELPTTWELTTLNSRYQVSLYADGTGVIIRQGGASPYVPPEVAARSYDGELFEFTDGKFEQDGFYEIFTWTMDGVPCHTSLIRSRKAIATAN